MLTGDWPVPDPQVGKPMVPQWSGPIGDAGSWFHGGVVCAGATVEASAALDGQSLQAATAPAAAPASFPASRRVSLDSR